MGFNNAQIANEVINELVKKKYGLLDPEEFEIKRSEVYTEIVSFLLYNYIKGSSAKDKERIRELRKRLDEEELIVTLMEEITSKKEVMQTILKRYSAEYIK